MKVTIFGLHVLVNLGIRVRTALSRKVGQPQSFRAISWEESVGIEPEGVHPATPAGWRSVGRYCGR